MSKRDNGVRAQMPAHSLVVFVGLGEHPGAELAEGLARDGVRGLWLDDVEQALAAAGHARFDAAVVQLDERLAPAARRFDDWVRRFACPLLLLADVEDEVDEIIALELGADAVLPRPVSPRRLRAHLLRLLRRSTADARLPAPHAVPEPPATAVSGWTLDRVHNRLQRNDRQVGLTELQALLMQVLLADFGRVVPRSRLLSAVSVRRPLQARSVDVYVARLRLRLKEERVDELQLEGVRGRGYRLTCGGTRAGAGSVPALAWSPPAPLRPLEVTAG